MDQQDFENVDPVFYKSHIVKRLYLDHPSYNAVRGKMKLPPSREASYFKRRVKHGLRLDQNLPTPPLQDQNQLQASLKEPDLITPDGDKLDFDKVDALLNQIGNLLDAQEAQKRLTYYEYFSVIAQLVTGGYKAYRGKPRNAGDLQIFKKDMSRFLEAFIEGCVEEMRKTIK